MGFELSAELQASGRVVVTEYAGVLGCPAEAAEELRAGVRTLLTSLDALCAAFGELGLLGPASRELAESAVERVTAEELRYLRGRSAELLTQSRPQPVQRRASMGSLAGGMPVPGRVLLSRRHDLRPARGVQTPSEVRARIAGAREAPARTARSGC